jgi:NAD-dependent dihydropyrimidine dehydrogenase PreA subunit
MLLEDEAPLMPRLGDEFKGYVRSHRPPAHCDNSAAKGGPLMKIRISRTAGAVVLASALVVSGLVLAQSAGKTTAPRGQAAEYASMCKFCENNTNGSCFAFSLDGGVDTNTCTYPPCSTNNMKTAGTLPELKLACATCRAICPRTSGAPAVQTTPDQKK